VVECPHLNLDAVRLAGCATTRVPTAPAAAQYAANAPPAAAPMVCSDEIRGQVTAALALDSVLGPAGGW
jgi:hypothetical protein